MHEQQQGWMACAQQPLPKFDGHSLEAVVEGGGGRRLGPAAVAPPKGPQAVVGQPSAARTANGAVQFRCGDTAQAMG